MRKLYTSPEADVIEFDVKDVITTSGAAISDNAEDYKENADGWSSGWL